MEKETTRTTSVYIDDTEKRELLLLLRNRDRRVVSCVHPSVSINSKKYHQFHFPEAGHRRTKMPPLLFRAAEELLSQYCTFSFVFFLQKEIVDSRQLHCGL